MNGYTIIGFFVTLLILIMTIDGKNLPNNDTLRCFDRRCFDGNREFVCEEEKLVCCAATTPNKYTVLKMQDGFRCCPDSGKMYNYLDQICVSGKIRPRKPYEENCGANGTYNMLTQVCCRKTHLIGRVYDIVEDGECCEDKYLTDPNMSCCERESYKISEKTCCQRLQNDYNLTNIPYGKCCNGVAYDPQSNSCRLQNGVLQVIQGVDDSLPRCGSKPYDNATHGCCIRGKPLIYEHLVQICKNGRLYNKNSPSHNDVCLFRVGLQQRAMSYSSDDQVCVEDGPITLGRHQAVCNLRVYNTSRDLCCAGKRYKNAKSRGEMCCENGVNYFNPRFQTCCNNVVNNAIALNDGAQCCFKKAYNTATHTCVHNNVVENECPGFTEKCKVTPEKISRFRSLFLRGKVYFYTGTVISDVRTTRGDRMWNVANMKQFKSKGGKLLLVQLKDKKNKGKEKNGEVRLIAGKCECPENLERGTEYLFAVRAGVRRKKLRLPSNKDGNDFVIPLSHASETGLLWSGLLKQT